MNRLPQSVEITLSRLRQQRELERKENEASRADLMAKANRVTLERMFSDAEQAMPVAEIPISPELERRTRMQNAKRAAALATKPPGEEAA